MNITTGPNTAPSEYETDDSGYSSYEDPSFLTESVHSTIHHHRYKHSRRSHALKKSGDSHLSCNDEPELFRMDMQYRSMYLASGSKLFHSPVKSPIHVLDLGTGTGIWALDMAKKHSEAEIIGVDQSHVQPDSVPKNVKFEINNVEDQWHWPEDHFDLIYSKSMLAGSVKNARRYFQQAYTHCTPGGYFECLETSPTISSDHYRIPVDNVIVKWTTLLKQAVQDLGSTLDVGVEKVSELMREVGFVDIRVKSFKIPIGTWPADPVLKEAGSVQLVAMLEGIEGLSLTTFTRYLDWTLEDTQELIEQTKEEFCRKRACYHWPGMTVYGRKPLPTEVIDEYF